MSRMMRESRLGIWLVGRVCLALFLCAVLPTSAAESADTVSVHIQILDTASVQADSSIIYINEEAQPDDFSKAHLDFPGRHIMGRPSEPDSTDVAMGSRRHFWRAAGETFGLNMALWAFDRYAIHGHYAYISWNTIKENFRHGFRWDDDYLATNMFAHPYNGAQYFTAGRANGYNFFQSELFAIGGSAMWELFMENEYPSTNDIIATPVGGAAIGEVLYRAADLITDDTSTGAERFGRELAAFVIDPMRGLNRIFTGQAWRTRSTPGRVFGIPPISIDSSLGLNMLTVQNGVNTTLCGAAAEIKVEYGDRYAPATRTPYDWFSLLVELNAMKSQPVLNRVEITGRLLSRGLLEGRRGDLSVGLYQHFDFFDSDTLDVVPPDLPWDACTVPYKFGTPASVGAGLQGRYVEPGRGWQLEGAAHADAVLLGGILTDYYRNYHRDYNWGSGYGLKGELRWALADHTVSLEVADQFYQIFTWGSYATRDFAKDEPSGVMGDASRAWFNHFEVQLNYRVWRRLFVSAGLDLYHRTTYYTDHLIETPTWLTYMPVISSNQIGFHLFLTYKL